MFEGMAVQHGVAASALPKGRDRDNAISAAASGWAKTDSAAALEWALSLPRNGVGESTTGKRWDATEKVFRAVLSTDPARAKSMAFGIKLTKLDTPHQHSADETAAPQRTQSAKISLRARNFISEKLKVNDKRGNPVEIATVVV